jgi:hypothetical protein
VHEQRYEHAPVLDVRDREHEHTVARQAGEQRAKECRRVTFVLEHIAEHQRVVGVVAARERAELHVEHTPGG